MAESISSRLRTFRIQNNPAASQAFLASQPGAAAAFGAGFLAPAVDRANRQAQEIEFLRALDNDRLARESAARQQSQLEIQQSAEARQQSIADENLRISQIQNSPERLAQIQAQSAEDRARDIRGDEALIDNRNTSTQVRQIQIQEAQQSQAQQTSLNRQLATKQAQLDQLTLTQSQADTAFSSDDNFTFGINSLDNFDFSSVEGLGDLGLTRPQEDLSTIDQNRASDIRSGVSQRIDALRSEIASLLDQGATLGSNLDLDTAPPATDPFANIDSTLNP